MVDRFFSSHPSPGERIENLGGLVGELSTTTGLRADSDAFRRVRARLEGLPWPEPVTAEAEFDVETDTARDALAAIPPRAMTPTLCRLCESIPGSTATMKSPSGWRRRCIRRWGRILDSTTSPRSTSMGIGAGTTTG